VLAITAVAFEYLGDIEQIPNGILGLGIFLFIYAIYVVLIQEFSKKTDLAHADIRRLNAISNRRIDETLKLISRSLHDDINPNILTSRNAIKVLLKNEDLSEKATLSLEVIANSLQEAYDRSRALSQDTCMELIDSIGFVAALESMASHYKTLFTLPRIKLNHNIQSDSNVEQQQGLVAFKIIREAVFNCIKHSKAENLTISVTYNKILDECAVTVSDDGVGIRDTLQSSNYGIGILDMREKAIALGAELKIYPLNQLNVNRPGTVVAFTFPGHSPI
jgi:two-component system sensor histidine kinase UhpB